MRRSRIVEVLQTHFENVFDDNNDDNNDNDKEQCWYEKRQCCKDRIGEDKF